MKKILASIFLLVFCLCLVGCEQFIPDSKNETIIDGEYYAKVIYDDPVLSALAYSRKVIIENNKMDDFKFVEYELKGDFFANTPNSNKEFSSIMNIEKIWFAKILHPEDDVVEVGYYLTLTGENYYLHYGKYIEENGYFIMHTYKLIRLDSEKEILIDFLTLLSPTSVTLFDIDKKDEGMIDKAYYDFESQLFFDEFMQIEVTELNSCEKYEIIDADYYISFSNSTKNYISLALYNVKNLEFDEYYGTIRSNILIGNYQFSINKNLFDKLIVYFSDNIEAQ